MSHVALGEKSLPTPGSLVHLCPIIQLVVHNEVVAPYHPAHA